VANGPVSASPSPITHATMRSGLSNAAPNACDNWVPLEPLHRGDRDQRVSDAGLLVHARIRPLRVMTIRNLEETEALVEEGGPSLARLLLDAHQRGDDGIALDDFPPNAQ